MTSNFHSCKYGDKNRTDERAAHKGAEGGLNNDWQVL